MGVLVTYDDGNRLEDVMRIVVQLSPVDTPFLSGTAKGKASNTYHEWPEDTLASQGDNAAVEGASFSYGTVTAPSRVANVTQIFQKTFHVSSTEQWVKGAGVDNMYTYQEQKAMKELARDIEHALLRGSKVTGNASTARKLAGVINFITTNATAAASGAKLTESAYNGLLELVYTNGYEDFCDEVYVGSRLKRIISAFTAAGTKYIKAEEKRLTNTVAVYEGDFGEQKIIMHRDIPQGTNASTLIAIKSDKFKVAIGEPVNNLPDSEVAQDTHGTKGVLRGELTLEVLGERQCAKYTSLANLFN